MEKTLLRVGEAAEFLAVSRWTIYRWVEQGRLEEVELSADFRRCRCRTTRVRCRRHSRCNASRTMR